MFLNAIQTCIFPTPLSIEPFESFFTTGSGVFVTENNSKRFTTSSHSEKQDLGTSTYAQLISHKARKRKLLLLIPLLHYLQALNLLVKLTNTINRPAPIFKDIRTIDDNELHTPNKGSDYKDIIG